jgi:2-polyprenyl-3-methyl-5-hydroxy-6-metoxy-1,4-benzoquinol methylase
MEISAQLIETPVNDALLPPESHPNYRLWANYAAFARYRGELVADILESFSSLASLNILDVGFGAGGTTLALAARGAFVTAIERNPQKVQKLRQETGTQQIPVTILSDGTANNLKFANETFDWVILQDVLEHLAEPAKAIHEARRVLKPNGWLYISTPNRWSPLNFVSDPHWNLPFVSVLPRKAVNWYITKLLQREKLRADFAALFSFFKLRRWLNQAGFEVRFVNTKIANAVHPANRGGEQRGLHSSSKLDQEVAVGKSRDAFSKRRGGTF